MANIFTEARIKFNELLQDARAYLSTVYNQNDKTFTPASPYGQILTVVLSIAQKIFYYIEDSVTELNMATASRENSIKGLAALTGHQPANANAATGTIKIRYNGNKLDDPSTTQIIIPNYTKIYSRYNNLPYIIEMNSEARFDTNVSSKEITAKIIQGEFFERTFTGTGESLQSFRINERYSDYIDFNSIKVFVNNVEYDRYVSLYDMPLGENCYMVRTSVGGGLDIFFGTIRNGRIPNAGSRIRVEYIRSSGNLGNILEATNIKFNFVDTGFDNFGGEIELNEFFDITPTTPIVFGSDPESLELTQIIAPNASRAYVLSNLDAYETYIKKMNYFSTVDIYNTFDDDNLNDDNVVYMFLIPNLRLRINPKFNYFTAPNSAFLMSDAERNELINKIEQSGQMLIGTELEIINPFIKRFALHIFIDWFTGYSKELIRTEILNALSAYFINYTRRDRIPKSDLIAIIEGITGVDSVNVFFKEDPNNFISGNSTYLNEKGDIIIGKRDYPIIRGGWVDPESNVSYLEGISETHPSSINITFEREVNPDSNRIRNKSVVSNIRRNLL